MPERLAVGVAGKSGNATGLLCLSLRERRSGRLTVGTDFGDASKPAREPQESAVHPRSLGLDAAAARQRHAHLDRAPGDARRRGEAARGLQRRPARLRPSRGVDAEGHLHRHRARRADGPRRARPAILKQVDTLQPRGETPLVYSVLQGAGDLKGSGGGNLVLVTDGEESCGGDIEAAKGQLKAPASISRSTSSASRWPARRRARRWPGWRPAPAAPISARRTARRSRARSWRRPPTGSPTRCWARKVRRWRRAMRAMPAPNCRLARIASSCRPAPTKSRGRHRRRARRRHEAAHRAQGRQVRSRTIGRYGSGRPTEQGSRSMRQSTWTAREMIALLLWRR